MSTIVLYHHPISGHCHRVALLLELLRLPYRKVLVDIGKGEQKQPEYLAKNPVGQVPLLVDGDLSIAESNAILVYLARKYADGGPWLPADPVGLSEVERWLSLAAGPLAFGPAAARVIAVFGRPIDPEPSRAIARRLFERMNQHLAARPTLAGDSITIADIAMYGYTARAPEGGVSLASYPNVRHWLERVEALPHFVPMIKTETKALVS